jgi:hypothetical protein
VPNDKPTRKRRRKPGDIAALQRVLWGILTRVEGIADDPTAEASDVLRAAHAVASVAGVYLRAVETGELVPRLEALEAQAAEARP